MTDLKYKEDSFEITASFIRPNDTTNYSNNDAISNSLSTPTCIEFFSAAKTNGQFAIINDIQVKISSTSGTPSIDFWIFNSPPTATNDNSDLNISSSDILNTETILRLDRAYNYGSSYLLHSTNVYDKYKVKNTTSSIYGLMQSKSAFSPIANDSIVIKIIGLFV